MTIDYLCFWITFHVEMKHLSHEFFFFFPDIGRKKTYKENQESEEYISRNFISSAAAKDKKKKGKALTLWKIVLMYSSY